MQLSKYVTILLIGGLFGMQMSMAMDPTRGIRSQIEPILRQGAPLSSEQIQKVAKLLKASQGRTPDLLKDFFDRLYLSKTEPLKEIQIDSARKILGFLEGVYPKLTQTLRMQLGKKVAAQAKPIVLPKAVPATMAATRMLKKMQPQVPVQPMRREKPQVQLTPDANQMIDKFNKLLVDYSEFDREGLRAVNQIRWQVRNNIKEIVDKYGASDPSVKRLQDKFEQLGSRIDGLGNNWRYIFRSQQDAINKQIEKIRSENIVSLTALKPYEEAYNHARRLLDEAAQERSVLAQELQDMMRTEIEPRLRPVQVPVQPVLPVTPPPREEYVWPLAPTKEETLFEEPVSKPIPEAPVGPSLKEQAKPLIDRGQALVKNVERLYKNIWEIVDKITDKQWNVLDLDRELINVIRATIIFRIDRLYLSLSDLEYAIERVKYAPEERDIHNLESSIEKISANYAEGVMQYQSAQKMAALMDAVVGAAPVADPQPKHLFMHNIELLETQLRAKESRAYMPQDRYISFISMVLHEIGLTLRAKTRFASETMISEELKKRQGQFNVIEQFAQEIIGQPKLK